MVRRSRVDPARNNDDVTLVAAGVAFLVLAWVGTWASLQATGQDASLNPGKLAVQVKRGDVAWTEATTWWAAAIAGGLSVAVAAIALLLRLVRGKRVEVDAAGSHMATRRDIEPLTRKQVTRTARKLTASADAIGLPLGYHLPSKARVWSTWEDMLLLIAGPRTMKSSSYVIPLALAAPGACFITENKRGVLDHTRGPRATKGQVWVFDPQAVGGEEPTWWWNPLSYVTDETSAEKLAAQIAESTREPGRGDAYFDNEAVNLLHLLLLAAASEGEPITTVYTWLTEPTDTHPVRVLDRAGYRAQAESLEALAMLTDKQRDGVYGSARALVGFLRNRQMMRWVTPPATPGVAEFDPHAYVRSSDTLYALSHDGKTSAGPLVGALTLAVFDAAEKYATSCAGGRLPTPLVGLLDEAANVCRFKDLDSKYSHYGSRGIIMMTVLQSWDQGEEIWGRHGMEKLWSAANIKVYGGGVSDTRFLQRLSDLIGPYEHLTGTTSSGRGGRSRSRSVTERPILSVAELGALPRRRAVVIASGIRPMLLKVVPWFAQDKTTREQVELSLATNTPAPAPDQPAVPVAASSTPTADADRWRTTGFGA
ncbi:TraM recognition domain-containing protein [Aeromicrobium sp. IC_218]|uniref:type IV secretory system conjugative DNA transfer family protein n=1 Tax=Aeromicrobium sp. IC_218 TaxID=2545468 RepID=UPI00103CD3B2|nr:TraM recognition domain-containing protein [Aeromicrobium sp. IC_218]TCI96380.1 conjugal transfer protein [Aeromicrobium sp. IC_218]